MNIAILYICTGKYKIFWKGFYESAEKYLLPDHSKRYYLFTDASEIEYSNSDNVTIIFQDKLGWPYDTLMRFQMFKKIEDELKKNDYIFFFNANARFVDYVKDEILPFDVESGLTAVLHQGYYKLKHIDYPYERNIRSKACIPFYKGENYFMGGFNGGTSKDYLRLINILRENINTDLRKGVIAIWHDESHLNKYLLNKKIKKLSPEYGFQESLSGDFKQQPEFKLKVLILDKNKFGGYSFLREVDQIREPLNIFNIIGKIKRRLIKYSIAVIYIPYRYILYNILDSGK